MARGHSAHPGEGRDPDPVAELSWLYVTLEEPTSELAIWIPAFAGMSGEIWD